ncbi:LamG-like jellyroll fold domain-containing protein [Taibaiella koreensis]|uniref:LamG-like jellyroll fold domain-containing protein n=1 Tax=Taibaiella koreensis TaxID=1268548 RepID=UPI0013C33D7F|nr:LamG-like jellyroll fold domain-containing protein [Taibaiella koreensis]
MKKFSALLLSFLIPGLLGAQVPDYVPTSNLVGWWPLDSTLIDSSSNSNNGTGNLFTYVTDRFGNANKACDFADNNAYVRFFNLPVNTQGNYTINYWMKLKSYQNYDVVQDFHPDEECGSYPQIWEMFDSLFIVKCNDVPSRRAIGPKTLFLDNWTMLTYSVTSDSTTIYINGVQKSKFAYVWSASTTASLILANGSNAISSYQNGAQVMIDDVGLWYRKLDDCEINGLFQSLPPAAITTQPITQTATIGGSTSFSITAASTTATFQWQSNIGPGGTFIDLPNTGQYSGAQSATLTVSNLTTINNNQLFRCIVKTGVSGLCSKISNIVSISITTSAIEGVASTEHFFLEQNIPNPASDLTTIRYDVPSFRDGAAIVLFGAQGQKIRTEKISKTGKGCYTLDTKSLEPGVYYYTLLIDGKKSRTRKMVVIH